MDANQASIGRRLPALLLSSCAANNAPPDIPVEPKTGEIYLYGEAHAKEDILAKELELWQGYYNDQGMRHLFMEEAYYTAEFMNLWMRSEDDTILEQLYKDSEGTMDHSAAVLEFYKSIKATCPETIFHGTDVGHQYDSTGAHYLAYLRENGLEQSEQYALASENMEQGKIYYRGNGNDGVYRENTMVSNFIREFDKLNGESIMGIYGSAHTNPTGMAFGEADLPCMANQLVQQYGDKLHTEDLNEKLKRMRKPLRYDTLTVGGVEYEAPYWGRQDLTVFTAEYQYCDFWRLMDAYDAFARYPTTGEQLPYDNYPMTVEAGEVFVIDYTKNDGTVERHYYRADGTVWNGFPTTEGISVEEQEQG